MRGSNVETLLIGGELDVATPPQWATRELLPHLPNGQRGRAREPRPHGRLLDLPAGREHASDQHVPRQRPRRHVPLHADDGRLHPGVSHGTIAEIVLGVMLGLAALTVLSLLWMALRVTGAVRSDARAAPRSGRCTRSCSGRRLVPRRPRRPDALPGVPLDDELLAMLSVGRRSGSASTSPGCSGELPARARGIGARSRGRRRPRRGLARVPRHTDLVALVTAIAGAIIGANVLLVALDMAWERSILGRPATATPPDAGAAPLYE